MSTASALLECIEVGPDDATQSVIWLHGLGASGDDFVPIVPALAQPQTRFVFPHAPRRPVTINMGFVMRAWYDITSLAPSATREPEADVREAAVQVEALIAAERARGIAANKIVVAGFSQGGAMALHVGLRHAEALAGIMVLSAYTLLPDTLEAEFDAAQRATPMFFGHGRMDPVVPMQRGRDAHQRASALLDDDSAPLWRDYAMEHQVCPEQVADIRAWLGRCLPPPSEAS